MCAFPFLFISHSATVFECSFRLIALSLQTQTSHLGYDIKKYIQVAESAIRMVHFFFYSCVALVPILLELCICWCGEWGGWLCLLLALVRKPCCGFYVAHILNTCLAPFVRLAEGGKCVAGGAYWFPVCAGYN